MMTKRWKRLINEGISSTVFHFCPLSTMYEISRTNAFKLSKTGKYDSDKRMTSLPTHIKGERKMYPFFMCFSRTPSTMVGYQLMRIGKTKNEWLNSLVRIEIDGDALNNNYKGMPVNFFIEKNPTGELAKKYADAQDWTNFKVIPNKYGNAVDRRLFSKGLLGRREMQKVNPDMNKRGRTPIGQQGLPKVDYKALERNRLSEYEDRLFSYSEYIRNADKYIKRIDILLSKKSLSQYGVLVMINKIIDRYGYDRVFVYDSQIAFNSMNIRGQISKSALNLRGYSDIGTDKVYNKKLSSENVLFELSKSDIDALATIIAMTAFIPDFNSGHFKERIKKICNEVGLNNWKTYDGYVDYTDTFIYYCNAKLDKLFFDKNVGFYKTFPTFTQYVSNFEKRNSGKTSLLKLFNDTLNIAKNEAKNFSIEIGDDPNNSVQVATKKKCLLYLQKNAKNH